MEVHTHSHTARKKWTHYFWEFLMLFLAVFCGFLAEYQLEHKIEKEKGVQYVRSFFEDLKTDTAELLNTIKGYDKSVNALENRRDCYNSLKAGNNSGDCLMPLFENSNSFTDLIQADQTLLQLKNAGGFRLLSKQDADSILLYDKKIRVYIKSETTAFQEAQYKIRNVVNILFNYEWQDTIKERNKIPVIFSANKELLNEYFNLLETYYFNSLGNLKDLKEIRQHAIRLIIYFKNKYRFN
jgi:hypothetical protein